jgi:hypothetical protein
MIYEALGMTRKSKGKAKTMVIRVLVPDSKGLKIHKVTALDEMNNCWLLQVIDAHMEK